MTVYEGLNKVKKKERRGIKFIELLAVISTRVLVLHRETLIFSFILDVCRRRRSVSRLFASNTNKSRHFCPKNYWEH